MLLILILLLPLSLSAGVKEYKLDNGLKVLVIEDHKSPLATFQIWYRVGSRDEPAGKSGISHLLEHMMFKGTPKYGSKAFSKMVKKKAELTTHSQPRITQCIIRLLHQTG